MTHIKITFKWLLLVCVVFAGFGVVHMNSSQVLVADWAGRWVQTEPRNSEPLVEMADQNKMNKAKPSIKTILSEEQPIINI